MPAEKLRIAFATPEYVTENHFDGGLANYLNRVSRKLADAGHDVHVVTLSQKDETEFCHEGVMVHRVTLKRWQLLSLATRYQFPTTLHGLTSDAGLSQTQTTSRQSVFIYPVSHYSSCGLLSIPFLRAAHVVRLLLINLP